MPKKHRNIKCKISDWCCVYHACMSDHCQRRFVMLDNKSLGSGNCSKKKLTPNSLKPKSL